jgi:hypothetical protein
MSLVLRIIANRLPLPAADFVMDRHHPPIGNQFI